MNEGRNLECGQSLGYQSPNTTDKVLSNVRVTKGQLVAHTKLSEREIKTLSNWVCATLDGAS